MPNNNYSVVVSQANSSNNKGLAQVIAGSTKNANGFRIGTYNSNGDLTNRNHELAVFSLDAMPPRGGTGTDAWGNINDDGTINASYNIATVSRTGDGEYDVEFTTAMPSDDYSVQTTCISTGTRDTCAHTFTTTGFSVNTYSASGNQQDQAFSFSVNATNAVLPNTITQEQLDAIFDGRAYTGVAAWGSVGSTGNLLQGHNVSSVREKQGEYTITFETPMPANNYAVVTGLRNGKTGSGTIRYSNQTVNDFSVYTVNASNNLADRTFSFAVIALNATPPRGGTGTDAWANVDVDGIAIDATGTLNASFNIASCTKTATGIYEFEFINPMPTANYSVQVNGNASMGQVMAGQTADGFRVRTRTNSGSVTNAEPVNVVVNASNAVLPATITEDQIAALIQNPTAAAVAQVQGDGVTANGPVPFGPRSFNIDSVTRTAEGTYTVTFVNDLDNDDYTVVGSVAQDGNAAMTFMYDDKQVGQFDIKIRFRDSSGTTQSSD